MNLKIYFQPPPPLNFLCQYIWSEVYLAFRKVRLFWSPNICSIMVRLSVSFILSKLLINVSFIDAINIPSKKTSFPSWQLWIIRFFYFLRKIFTVEFSQKSTLFPWHFMPFWKDSLLWYIFKTVFLLDKSKHSFQFFPFFVAHFFSSVCQSAIIFPENHIHSQSFAHLERLSLYVWIESGNSEVEMDHLYSFSWEFGVGHKNAPRE